MQMLFNEKPEMLFATRVRNLKATRYPVWLLAIFLLTISSSSMAEWVEYSTMPNRDVFFYDNARVERKDNQITVWTRIRYKTSVMAASSYQSFSKLNCTENSETLLQSTFYTDRDWKQPAMTTNMNAKQKILLKPGFANWPLVVILCKEA